MRHSRGPTLLALITRPPSDTGVQFMYDHYREDEGALLGDVMGLGKTIQVRSLH